MAFTKKGDTDLVPALLDAGRIRAKKSLKRVAAFLPLGLQDQFQQLLAILDALHLNQ